MKKLLILLWLFVAGCTKPITLYPIEKTDIFRIEQGTRVGTIIAEKDGWFISDFYIEEIMQTKVRE